MFRRLGVLLLCRSDVLTLWRPALWHSDTLTLRRVDRFARWRADALTCWRVCCAGSASQLRFVVWAVADIAEERREQGTARDFWHSSRHHKHLQHLTSNREYSSHFHHMTLSLRLGLHNGKNCCANQCSLQSVYSAERKAHHDVISSFWTVISTQETRI